MKNILITGSTGFLGKEFVRQLLRETDHHLYLLVRVLPGASKERRTFSIEPQFEGRITCIEGDIVTKDVFRNAEDRKRCEEIIDEVVHMAASVEFKESKRAEIYEVNLTGTANLLQAAKKFKRLSCFNHISTTYVAGDRFYPEVIPEAPLAKAPSYKNPYEESKHAAEQAVIDSGLPWTIMRPSIIVGSRDGNYFSDNTMYVICSIFLNARQVYLEQTGVDPALSMDFAKKVSLNAPVLAKPDTRLNVINVDVAAEMIRVIMASQEKLNKFFHISSPETILLDMFMEPLLELLNIDKVFYADKKDVQPETLPPAAAALFWPMKALAGYLSKSHPTFSLDNTTRILGKEYIVAMPRLHKENFRLLLTVFLKKTRPDFYHSEPVKQKKSV